MILLYSRKLSMQYYGCAAICVFCVVKTVEQAETNRFSIDHDPDPPFLRLAVPADALEAAGVASHPVAIAIVFGASSQPQIDPTVVVFARVLMIDFASRPVAFHDYPSEAASEISRAINGDTMCAVTLFPPCGFSRLLPRQNPGCGIVVKEAPNVIGGEVIASHRGSIHGV